MGKRKLIEKFNESWYHLVKDTYIWNFSKEIIDIVAKWKSENETVRNICGLVDIRLYDGEHHVTLEIFHPNCCEIDLNVIIETDIQHPKANEMINLLHKLHPLDKSCNRSEKCRCYYCVLNTVKKFTDEEIKH